MKLKLEKEELKTLSNDVEVIHTDMTHQIGGGEGGNGDNEALATITVSSAPCVGATIGIATHLVCDMF